MAEQDRGSAFLSSSNEGGATTLPYVTRTPTSPVAILLALAIIGGAVYVTPGIAGSDGLSAVVRWGILGGVWFLVLVHLASSGGRSGRFGKQVRVDHSGVTVTPLLARVVPALAAHLPAGGLWFLEPDEALALDPALRSAEPRDSTLNRLLRWFHGEQTPPEQVRVLVGHANPDLRWHSLKTRDRAGLVAALATVAESASADFPNRRTLAAFERLETTIANTDSEDSGWPRLWIGSIGAIGITVALRHSGWDLVLLIAGLVPYTAYFGIQILIEMVSAVDHGVAGRRVAGFVVGYKRIYHSRRTGFTFRAVVRVTGSDGVSVDFEETWSNARYRMPLGSPVPMVNRTDPVVEGKAAPELFVQVDHHDQAQGIASGAAFLPICLLTVLIWTLWVLDALVGGP